MPSGCIDCPKCGRYQCFELVNGRRRCLYNLDCGYSPDLTQGQSDEERMEVIESILEGQNLLRKVKYCVVYTINPSTYAASSLNLGVIVWTKGVARGKVAQDEETLKRTEGTLLGRKRAETLAEELCSMTAADLDAVIPKWDDGDLRFTWPSAELIYPITITIDEILEELFQKHVQKRS